MDEVMSIIIKRVPRWEFQKIPGSHQNKQFFLTPGVLVGRGYFTIFWITFMLTISFNTTLEWDNE